MTKCDEVLTVEDDNGSFMLGGKRENVFIRDTLVGLSCVVGGEDIIAQSAQFPHDIHRKVLVGVELNHPHPHQEQQWRDRLLRGAAHSMPRQLIGH